jgi:hypothetical protein
VLGSQVPIPAHDPDVLDVMSSDAAKVLGPPGRGRLSRRREAVACSSQGSDGCYAMPIRLRRRCVLAPVGE